MTASALYEGWVRHRRMEPIGHEFRYRLFMSYLDLGELPELLDRVPLWSARRPAPAWFRRRDYMEVEHDGPVRLLTHVRTFGHLFNPVSFYYCFDRADTRVERVVAVVTNTPWGERHAYELDPADNGYAGELREVREALAAGRTESHVMPLDESLAMMGLLEAARAQLS